MGLADALFDKQLGAIASPSFYMLSLSEHENPDAPCLAGQSADYKAGALCVALHKGCHHATTASIHRESRCPTHLQLFGFDENQAEQWKNNGLPIHVGSPSSKTRSASRLEEKRKAVEQNNLKANRAKNVRRKLQI
mmetsp:Transcript_13806/g.23331  ORF Transcript_13806/g.23331 Transcript_13806/m.23331 type:complete len:136 (-) Transcript_13806:340-747(-)